MVELHVCEYGCFVTYRYDDVEELADQVACLLADHVTFSVIFL